jgi:hypothetical protein
MNGKVVGNLQQVSQEILWNSPVEMNFHSNGESLLFVA